MSECNVHIFAARHIVPNSVNSLVCMEVWHAMTQLGFTMQDMTGI